MSLYYKLDQYNIVQTGPVSYSVKYINGPMIGNFSKRYQAIAWADSQIDPNAYESISSDPKTLNDALNLLNNYKSIYESFLSKNPNASDETKQPYFDNINYANNFVVLFLSQQESSRLLSNSSNDFIVKNLQQKVSYANTLLDQAISSAISNLNS